MFSFLFSSDPIFVSLGINCYPAIQLNHFKLRNLSFPFDWNWTPFESLYNTINTDFKNFLDLKHMVIAPLDDVIYHTTENFRFYHHQFTPAFWYNSDHGLTTDDPVQYEQTLALYHRRINRFYEIWEDSRIKYIFRYRIKMDEAISLRDLLNEKFNDNFILICMNDTSEEAPWYQELKQIKHYLLDYTVNGAPCDCFKHVLEDLRLIQR